jgi:peptidoglycan/LPS O-acetylase OafA/YrhL
MEYVKTGLKWAVGIPHIFFEPRYFDGVFWSLWVELGFYTLLPILFWALRGRTVWQTGATITSILLVVPFVGRWLVRPIPDEQWLYLNARLPNALTNFSWGVLFACFFTVSQQNIGSLRKYAKIGYAGVALMAISMLLAASKSLSRTGHDWRTAELVLHLVGFSTFLMLFFLFDQRNAGTRFFSSSILRYLGLISYEWFLLHQPALYQFRGWMGSAQGEVGRYLLIVLTPMAGSLAVAAVIYHWFSTPIMKWGRKRVNLSRTAESRTAALSGSG